MRAPSKETLEDIKNSREQHVRYHPRGFSKSLRIKILGTCPTNLFKLLHKLVAIADVDLPRGAHGHAASAVLEVDLALPLAPSRRRRGGGAGRPHDQVALAPGGEPPGGGEVVEAGTALGSIKAWKRLKALEKRGRAAAKAERGWLKLSLALGAFPTPVRTGAEIQHGENLVVRDAAGDAARIVQ